MNIIGLHEKPELLSLYQEMFWKEWGTEGNRSFYMDCIQHALNPDSLPKFYLGFEENQPIGMYALLTNDLVSRQDLWPWLACLWVHPTKRKQKKSELLMQHALGETERLGYFNLYLTTDLQGFYERKGWTLTGSAVNPFGESFQLFQCCIQP